MTQTSQYQQETIRQVRQSAKYNQANSKKIFDKPDKQQDWRKLENINKQDVNMVKTTGNKQIHQLTNTQLDTYKQGRQKDANKSWIIEKNLTSKEGSKAQWCL